MNRDISTHEETKVNSECWFGILIIVQPHYLINIFYLKPATSPSYRMCLTYCNPTEVTKLRHATKSVLLGLRSDIGPRNNTIFCQFLLSRLVYKILSSSVLRPRCQANMTDLYFKSDLFSRPLRIKRSLCGVSTVNEGQWSTEIYIIIIIINNFKAWANWSVPRQLSSQLVMFSPF
jgi:hypothetical protein